MKQLYVDINELARNGRNGPIMCAIISQGGDQVNVTPCGVNMYMMPASDRERAYDIARDCIGMEFLFEDAPKRAMFYPVPFMTVFAHDRAGGWFCSLGQCADMHEEVAVYYVDEARRCIYLAPSLRALLTAAVFDTGFMRRAGCTGGMCALSYADQQYMIDKMGLKAGDAARLDDVRPASEVRVYMCREIAERELEFVRPFPHMGGMRMPE